MVTTYENHAVAAHEEHVHPTFGDLFGGRGYFFNEIRCDAMCFVIVIFSGREGVGGRDRDGEWQDSNTISIYI